MIESSRPIHPTLKHPLTGKPLVAVGCRPNGRPIWPIMGGDDTVPPVVTPPEGTPPVVTPPEVTPPSGEAKFTQEDVDRIFQKRFPAIKEWETKATQFDQLQAANATDMERAVEAARQETRTEVTKSFGTQLASGVIEAQLEAKGKKPEEITAIVESLNLAKFVNDDGSIDKAEISKTLAIIAPASAPDSPPDLGQGGGGAPPGVQQMTKQQLDQLYADKKYGEIEKARQEGRLATLLGG